MTAGSLTPTHIPTGDASNSTSSEKQPAMSSTMFCLAPTYVDLH